MSDLKNKYPKIFEFFENNEFSATTFLNKYSLRNKEGEIVEDDPNTTIDRVMGVLSKAMPTEFPTQDWINIYNSGITQSWKEIFIEACKEFKGLCPQGSILSGAGNLDFPQSLSNCFCVPSPHDSISGIMKANEQMAQIYKRRGGAGIDLSTLRPDQAKVANAALMSSGAWGWANHFSNTCRDVAQKGRRGASMQTLHIKHPDSEKWAQMKSDKSYCTGSNISLWITDEFMAAVTEDKEFTLQFPVDSDSPIIKKTIRARDLWKTVCTHAKNDAEPGLLFRDCIERNLPAHYYPDYKVCSTNPCSEIPLSEFDACRLATICLTKYVQDKFLDTCHFNFESFKKDIRIGMRLMDSVVTAEIQQLDLILNKITSGQKDSKHSDIFNTEIELWTKIKEAGINGRRCGLGTHGLGDCLAQLKLKYDSLEAINFIDSVYSCFRDTAYDESVEMAKEYGPFPAFDWELEKDCEFIKRLPEWLQEKIKLHGRRNISLLTMAPTGTISILSQVSSGIEPTFRHMYLRRRKINQNDVDSKIDFIDSVGDKWQNFPQFEKNITRYFNAINEELPVNIKNDDDLQKHLPDYFITSDKIDWKKRIEIQGTIQLYIDHSISSTLNLPRDTSVEVVQDLYELAWKKGLKGVTVYVEGSRDGVLISNEEVNKKEQDGNLARKDAPKRPDKLPCDVHFVTVKGKRYVVIVGLLQGSVYEVFFGKYNNQIPEKNFSGYVEKKSKSKYILNYIDEVEFKQVDINKYFSNEDYAAATRLLSMSLRHGVPLTYILEQLQKSSASIIEFGSAVSRILKKYVKIEDLKSLVKCCSKCNSSNIEIKHENGCLSVLCKDCAYVDSKCN